MEIIDTKRRLAGGGGPKLFGVRLERSPALGQDCGMHDDLLVLNNDAALRRLRG